MAWMRWVEQKCECGKRANYQVIDKNNYPVGIYCKDCAEKKVRALRAKEYCDTSIGGLLPHPGNE